PLSRFTYPNFRASREAIVLLPAPAGPSIAIVSRRGAGSSFPVSAMRSLKIVHVGRAGTDSWSRVGFPAQAKPSEITPPRSQWSRALETRSLGAKPRGLYPSG